MEVIAYPVNKYIKTNEKVSFQVKPIENRLYFTKNTPINNNKSRVFYENMIR